MTHFCKTQFHNIHLPFKPIYAMISDTLLLVDDNEDVLDTLELLLCDEFREILRALRPDRILNILNSVSIDIIILDMNFSAGINTGNEGLYWLHRIREIKPDLPVIMLTAYGNVELAVAALKNGATDFILKPWENQKLLDTLRTACQKTSGKRVSTQPEIIIGTSSVMQKLLWQIHRVATTDANILITGENGTGKELIAREIHRLSKRNQRPMISVDMGAISETLFESELFGHEKGAFTDAKECRVGKFEAASQSSLFLDEIGNLSFSLQGKLLSALQNREISRLGSNKKISIDIRLISATNKDIRQMVRDELFREDLLYRINTIQLEVPPLRERGEDILLLLDFFLKKYTSKYNRAELKLHEQAKHKLLTYHWPGNVRELQHKIERAVILCEHNLIQAEDIITEHIQQPFSPETTNLEQIERQVIRTAISRNNGNLSASAEQLGISRQTLYNKMKRYHL